MISNAAIQHLLLVVQIRTHINRGKAGTVFEAELQIRTTPFSKNIPAFIDVRTTFHIGIDFEAAYNTKIEAYI